MKSVRQFFEQQGDDYKNLYPDISRAHRSAAAVIEQTCSGRVISVGGLWPGADLSALPINLTIFDLSPKMLSIWHHSGAKSVCADARQLPMVNESVDTVVFPMVLHHVCEGTANSAQQGVRDVFGEAYRVLAPGGRLLLFDWSVPGWLYRLELALSGVTSRLLAFKEIPLVVMHSARFYEKALAEAGFVSVEHVGINEQKERPFQLVRPIIGLSSFVIPRFAYPVSQLFLVARRSAEELPTSQ